MGMQGIFGEGVDRIGGEPIAARMARKAPFRHLDPTLLIITLILAAYGALMVYSATAGKQETAGLDPSSFLNRQLFYITIGFALLLMVSFFDYRHIRSLTPVIYGGSVLTLILVLTGMGEVRNGTRGWFDLGVYDLQPAEIAKVVVILAVAAFLAERKADLSGVDVTLVVAIAGLPSLLIFVQPDLGTMMVFVFVTLALLVVGGAKLRHFLALFGLGLVGLVVVFQANLIQDYQVERLTSFLDATPDVQSEGYNQAQSLIAIGSGGVRGKGFRSPNTQTSLDFVPEQHTDFIFTAVGEQLGFLGSAGLLLMFALLIWRALRIATLSRDLFGTLVACGIAAMWAFHVFLNMGMTMGIMPITGVPLPFMSFGGSAMLANFVAVGLLLNIHMRRFLRA